MWSVWGHGRRRCQSVHMSHRSGELRGHGVDLR
ncbi:hypothetical protein Ae505Ps2_2738 [Pseudonocardia sp. Ae505_Ps2]|nr:hypothetical protein Ae505Ps2_2738 [Pseudonocardia sp. Ae505_Ps2]